MNRVYFRKVDFFLREKVVLIVRCMLKTDSLNETATNHWRVINNSLLSIMLKWIVCTCTIVRNFNSMFTWANYLRVVNIRFYWVLYRSIEFWRWNRGGRWKINRRESTNLHLESVNKMQLHGIKEMGNLCTQNVQWVKGHDNAVSLIQAFATRPSRGY